MRDLSSRRRAPKGLAIALAGAFFVAVPAHAGDPAPDKWANARICQVADAGAVGRQTQVAQAPPCAVGTRTLPNGTVQCAIACGQNKAYALAKAGFPDIHFQGTYAACVAWRAARSC